MLKRFYHLRRFQKDALAYLMGVLLISLTITVYQRVKGGEKNSGGVAHVALPPDVDSVMRGFRYQENSPRVTIDISGNEAVLRGRKIMVFRTNLAKTTFFKALNGSITSNERTISFTSDTGEWDTTKNSPFVLEQNIQLKVDGETIPGVKSVRIHFNRQTVETEGQSNTVYTF
jgi:hypothetical protein